MTEVIEDGGKDDLVISERVQVLAQGIYEEFQNLIGLYGPQSITNLMPLVVSVLESLDSSLADNKDHLTALSEVNEENGQLTAQYERERNKRKEAEEKAMHIEATLDQDNKLLREHSRKLELDNRDLSAKNRTQLEQIGTYEERTEQLKREKKELHDRNIELIKSIELLKAARAGDHKRSHGNASSPSLLKRSPGYQNFAPSIEARRRRHLPATPNLKRAVTCPEGMEGDDMSQTNSSPDLLSPPPPPPLLSAGTSRAGVYQEALHTVQNDEILLDGFHGTPVIPSEVATSNDVLLEAHSVQEHALDEHTLGGLQMEQPSMEEEQDVLDSTLESWDDPFDHETSLFDELKDVGGMEEIITENEQLNTAKIDLVKQLDTVTNLLRDANLSVESSKAQLVEITTEKEKLNAQLKEAEQEVKKQKQQIKEMQERGALNGEVSESADGTRITRLEVTRLLRERNEFKEKYLSLLEQIRMSDELSVFKKKERRSRWVDYFTAVFSSNKRKQMEDMHAESSSPRKPLLNGGKEASEEEDGGFGLPGAVGYSKTKTIPTFKRLTRKQEEAYLTSASWALSVHDHTHDNGTHGPPPQSFLPNINTCRPVSSLEEGGDILCAAAISPAVYLEDCMSAIRVKKDPPPAFKEGDGTSTSLIWVVTGVPSLTKVSVIDAATVGEVMETFPVCATPICCICTVPAFDPNDPDATTGLTTRKQSSRKQRGDSMSSKHATVWMGALDTGELYVHSAMSNWKRCIHADKLQAGIQAITHLGGKAFVLLKDASVAVFRRFTDGEWDWDNYLIVVLCQRKEAQVTCLTAAKLSLWCAVGNVVYVINSRTFKMEATITVHPRKKAEVNQMVAIGEGVWISFKFSSTIKLFHSTAFNHMQDVDIAPPIHKMLSFGSEKRSAQTPIQVSTLLATYSCLWVGTENGIIVSFPFTTPIIIAEESGWEVLKTAEVPGRTVMEPFDVRTEHATEAAPDAEQAKPLPSKHVIKPSPNHRPAAIDTGLFAHRGKIFSPFCNVEHMQLSIHNHVNSVKALLCVPCLMQMDLTFEPHQGILVGPTGPNQMKPALFIVSFGEGHLDLRTADKIMQALHTKDSGLPSPTSIISEKNYIMVWDLVP